MITLSDGSTTITLPPDLQWPDEFSWSSIEQEREYSLTGALQVQQGEKLKGRPISLQSNGASWATRTVCVALQAYYDAGQENYTLDYHGTEYAVQFERPGGFNATEVMRGQTGSPPTLEAFYTINLKFFEVEA